MQPTLSLLSTALVGLLLATPVLAQKDDSPRTMQLAGFHASEPWRDFLQTVGGQWHVDWNVATGTPASLWGSGIPLADWNANTLEEGRRHANQLLERQRALLGLGTSEFREVIGARMGRIWSFTFQQYFRGLRVVGGRADVRVHMVGRVPMFGSTAWQLPADFAVAPAVGPEVATGIAWQSIGGEPNGVPQMRAANAPELVVWGDVHASTPQTPVLAWEVTVHDVAAGGVGRIGRCYVDARTGAVLRFVDDKHACGTSCTHGATETPAAATAAPAPAPAPAPTPAPVATTVTVMGWSRGGVAASGPLVNLPMRGLVLNVPGIGSMTTDDNGQFTVNLAAAVQIVVGPLDGRHHQPISGGSGPTGTFTVQPGVPATIQLLSAGASAENVAHTNAARWIDTVNQWARGRLGNSAQLNTISSVGVAVNVGLTCNAYYWNNGVNFYATGGGCSNTSFSSVVLHEWGHGIDDRYGGISQTHGLSEGWGDIVSMYVLDHPDIGLGFSGSGALRSGTNATQYPSSSPYVHDQGQSFMGFAWKLRERLATTFGNRALAIALTEDIVFGSIVADATDQPSAVQQVFLADDDDGNLANGTPHAADLIWACQQHSLPHPGPTSGLLNDECTFPTLLQNGVAGPFSTVGATTSPVNFTCAAAGNDVWFYYPVAEPGLLVVATCALSGFDTVLQVFSGDCNNLVSLACSDDACGRQSLVSVNVQPGRYLVRVGGYAGATGTFSLQVQGPSAYDASVAAYGTGCGTATRSFFENFAAGSFDMNGIGMQMVRVDDRYQVDYGAQWIIPPSNATLLPLPDDGQITIPLQGVMPYPGSFTTSLVVCSNGFVSADLGNGTSPLPSASAWLASPSARWGTWMDFDPSAPGSGKVKTHVQGSVQCITWDGVYRYGTTVPHQWQLQFDTATGDVACVWQSMPQPGATLVGFAAAAPNVPSTSRDLTAAMPFATSEFEMSPLQLDCNLPKLGQLLTFTTSNIPYSSQFGLQVLGLQRLDPGVPLDFLGMTGCNAYTNIAVSHAIWPGAGYATWSMPIPFDLSLIGFTMHAQSLVMAPAVNAASLASSQGLRLRVGW